MPLIEIDLGTAPLGEDGDSNRAANTKTNQAIVALNELILVVGAFGETLTALEGNAVLKDATSTDGWAWVVDEDNMASNSASKVPTQQSVREFASNAGNLSSGALPAARLPLPGTTTRGGVMRNVGTAGQFVTGVQTDGSLLFGTPPAGDAMQSGTLAQFAATTSDQLRGVLSDETGTGAAVFGTSPTLATPNINGAINFQDGVRQTFNPNGTAAGLNVGSHTSDPSTPTNGDLWYNSAAGGLRARINGASVSVGDVGGPASSTDNALARFDATTGKLIQNSTAILSDTGVLTLSNITITASTLAYAGTTTIDLLGDGFQTVTLTGNITFQTSNRAAGRSKTIRIIGDGSNRTLAFPAWKFVGAAAPSALASGKTAILTLTAFGTADTDIVAAFAAEA